MTHEEYVSLETAKMLRSAGFDWEVRAHYCPKEMPNLLYDGYLSDKWNYDGCYSAPTQAVAQRWLREVKGYDVYVFVSQYATEMAKYAYRFLYEGSTVRFPTYEAALEAGLQKCLTLILERK